MIARVPSAMASYVDEYLRTTREQMQSAGPAGTPGRPAALKTLGHNLKGSAPSFGLEELGALGVELERAAAAGEGLALADTIARLREYLDAVRVEYE